MMKSDVGTDEMLFNEIMDIVNNIHDGNLDVIESVKSILYKMTAVVMDKTYAQSAFSLLERIQKKEDGERINETR